MAGSERRGNRKATDKRGLLVGLRGARIECWERRALLEPVEVWKAAMDLWMGAASGKLRLFC